MAAHLRAHMSRTSWKAVYAEPGIALPTGARALAGSYPLRARLGALMLAERLSARGMAAPVLQGACQAQSG